jgi:hypothetical protein
MSAFCHNPTGERHEIPGGARRLDLTFRVDWGGDDLREPHAKPLTFCSFACLTAWAADRAEHHDGVTLMEGQPC